MIEKIRIEIITLFSITLELSIKEKPDVKFRLFTNHFYKTKKRFLQFVADAYLEVIVFPNAVIGIVPVDQTPIITYT